MLTTLPLECFVCREVMFNYWFPNEPWNANLHLIFTTSLVFTAMALSLITCDLGSVFELIGATSACALAYILPPLCYVKLSTRSWKTVPAVGCVAFGMIVMTSSLLQATSKMIKNEGSAHTCRWQLEDSRIVTRLLGDSYSTPKENNLGWPCRPTTSNVMPESYVIACEGHCVPQYCQWHVACTVRVTRLNKPAACWSGSGSDSTQNTLVTCVKVVSETAKLRWRLAQGLAIGTTKIFDRTLFMQWLLM